MKMRIEGAMTMFGTSKAGNDVDFGTLFVGVACESKNVNKLSFKGVGRQVAEMDLDPKAFPLFKALEGKYPIELDLETDTQYSQGRMKTVVVGIKGTVAAASPLKAAV